MRLAVYLINSSYMTVQAMAAGFLPERNKDAF